MMRTASICILSVAAVAVVLAGPAPDPTPAAAKRSTAHKTTVRNTRPVPRTGTTTSSATAQGHRPTTKTISAHKKTYSSLPKQAVTWRTRQAAPAPERYREIQQALAAKGYLPADKANGAWDDSSMDALRRFQADQNLDSSGKINSLSLIALGLGPKHDAVDASKPDAGQLLPKPEVPGDGR